MQPSSSATAHPWSRALLVVGAIVPLIVVDHWFREDDYLLFYHQGTIAPWRVWSFFSGSEVFFWRPLQGWLVSILWHTTGLSPVPWNLALVAGWLAGLWQLERLASELGQDRRLGLATLGAALGLAGTSAMTAFWVSLIGAAWGTALALFSMRLWLRHARAPSGSPVGSWGAALALSAAILMKESLAVLVVLVPLLVVASGISIRALGPRRWVPLIVPMLVSLVTFLVSTRLAGAGSDITRHYPRVGPLDVPGNVAEMLNTLAWPLSTASDVWLTPVHRLSGLLSGATPWLPFLLVALAVLARNRIAIFGGVWALVGCFPAALLEHNFHNRYLHLPSLGLALLVAALVSSSASRVTIRARRVLAGCLAAYAVVSVISWGLLLENAKRRADYGRALEAAFEGLVIDRPTRIVLEGLPSERTNHGLGLREFARLFFDRDDVTCVLRPSLDDPAYRTDPELARARAVVLEYDGARFLERP